MTRHGTYGGYQGHKLRGEPVCQECREAHLAYVAGLRFRRGEQHGPRRCRDCGSVFPEHRCGGVVTTP